MTDQPGTRPKFTVARVLGFALSLLAIAAVMVGLVLLLSNLDPVLKQDSWKWAVFSGLLFGIVLLLCTHWFNLREQWLELARTMATIAPLLVKPGLLVLLGAVLGIAYKVMNGKAPFNEVAPGHASMLLLGVLFLCSAPALLTLGVSLLVERRMARGDFAFEVNPAILTDKRNGAELVRHAQANWVYERELMEGSIHRMGRHAAILGFLASSIVISCITILVVERDYIALAVGTAAIISFTLHLGQIFFRSASNDATARMMARASRTLLIVSICALFFGALFLEDTSQPPSSSQEAQVTGSPSTEGDAFHEPPLNGRDKNPLRGRAGALLIGIAVALIGERMLQMVTHRAASLLGVEGSSAPKLTDLSVIDGLNEDDAARLAEERIDSIHALAFTPTARIFFNTVYGLQRICDWQDQALLIERVGRTNALLLREQFFIRGAIAGRRLALQKFGQASEAVPEKPDTTGAEAAAPGVNEPDSEPKQETASDRGAKKPEEVRDFENESHIDRALRSLADDENIDMLELFWRSVPVLKQP